MDIAMKTRKLAIEGDWYNVQFFKQSDGAVRVELSHNITGKHYKMYPDNLVTFEENKDGQS
jgi:hypothetical protein